MAGSQDFERRRRERLQRQRKQRERARMIRYASLIALFIIVVIIIIVSVTKCAGSDPAETADGNEAVVTQIPAEPTATAETRKSDIPAPKTGDNNFLDEVMRSGQKGHVYLTFDDGPNEEITPQVLDILRKYNVKATFFMVGRYIEKSPAMCTRVIEEGHLAAVHAYTHDYPTIYASDSSFRDEVERTYQLIVDHTPGHTEPFKIFRFPGGGFDDENFGPEKQNYKNSLAEMGYYYCDWNSLTGDAEGSSKNASQLIEYFNSTRPNVNNLIVLMHDAIGKQATVDALPQLIEQLLSEGYTFSRLDELDYSSAPASTESADASPSPSAGSDSAADASSENDTGSSSSSASGSSSGSSSGGSSSSSSSSGSSSSGSSRSSSGGSSSGSSSGASRSSSSSESSGSGSSGSESDDDTVTRTTTTTSGETTTENVNSSESDENVLDPE